MDLNNSYWIKHAFLYLYNGIAIFLIKTPIILISFFTLMGIGGFQDSLYQKEDILYSCLFRVLVGIILIIVVVGILFLLNIFYENYILKHQSYKLSKYIFLTEFLLSFIYLIILISENYFGLIELL